MTTKHFAVLFYFNLIALNAISQLPAWQWGRSNGGVHVEQINDLHEDYAGNLYVTGTTESPFIYFGNDTIVPSGGVDIIIAKYDLAGNPIWARSAYGYFTDFANSVATDSYGNVYVCGSFMSHRLIIGVDTILNYFGNTSYNAFLIKFDSAGNYLWGKSFGGNSQDYSTDVTIDDNDNIILCGYFLSDSVFFDTILLHSTGVTSIFTTKLDSLGNVLWANTAIGSGYDRIRSIYTDHASNIYITGQIGGNFLTFDSITMINNHYPAEQFFITKYGHGGNVLWCKSSDSYQHVEVVHISGEDSSLYVTGNYIDSLILENDTLFEVDTGFTNSDKNIFLAKYSSVTGDLQWSKRLGGNSKCNVSGVIKQQNGNNLLCGYYQEHVFYNITAIDTDTVISYFYFNSGSIVNVDSISGQKLFFYSFDSNGNNNWFDTLEGFKVNIGNGGHEQFRIVATGDGGIAIAAVLGGDSLRVRNIFLPDSRFFDWFVVKSHPFLTGINTLQITSDQISVYPNPSTGKFLYVLSSDMRNATINIYDIYGKKVFAENLKIISTNQVYELLFNASAGIYFINFSNQYSSHSIKVIVSY